MEVKTILGKQELSKTDLVALLDCRDTTEAELFRHSRQLRDATIGNGVHMRGLIEISNVCIKDCLYCGIRKSNSQAQRYELNDEEIVEAAIFAYRNHYGSVVLQGGERHDPAFILRIERLVREIKHLSNQRFGDHSLAGRTNRRHLPEMVRCRSSPLSAPDRNFERITLPKNSSCRPAS